MGGLALAADAKKPSGTVVIEDNVEIGANSCVDRGALGETLIHDSTAQGVPEEEARRNINAFFTPGRYAFTTFAGLLGVGTVNALVFAVLQHKVLRRFRNR